MDRFLCEDLDEPGRWLIVDEAREGHAGQEAMKAKELAAALAVKACVLNHRSGSSHEVHDDYEGRSGFSSHDG